MRRSWGTADCSLLSLLSVGRQKESEQAAHHPFGPFQIPIPLLSGVCQPGLGRERASVYLRTASSAQ